MGKPDDMLEELSRSRINEEAVNIEKVYFYKTDKRVNPKQEDPFWFSHGKLPILVSAPHAVPLLYLYFLRGFREHSGNLETQAIIHVWLQGRRISNKVPAYKWLRL